MHALAIERFMEVEEMSSTIAALNLENQAASSEMQKMKLAICGPPVTQLLVMNVKRSAPS